MRRKNVKVESLGPSDQFCVKDGGYAHKSRSRPNGDVKVSYLSFSNGGGSRIHRGNITPKSLIREGNPKSPTIPANVLISLLDLLSRCGAIC